jgi:hypothetical protein
MPDEFAYGFVDRDEVLSIIRQIEPISQQTRNLKVELQWAAEPWGTLKVAPVLDLSYYCGVAFASDNWRVRVEWAKGLIREFLSEIREQICGKGKKPSNLGIKSQSLVAGIAVALAHKFGFDGPYASGVAVLILMAIANATKKSFCKMTDEEVLRALEDHNFLST